MSDRVVVVLEEASGPLRPVDVRREFERRGWINKAWKAPSQSVYNALKRAEELGLATRENDGRWKIAGKGVTVSS